MLENLNDDIKQIKLKIDKPAKDIDSLGQVMNALEEIRKKESEIDIDFRPVIEMFALLENSSYLENKDNKDEIDPSSILEKDWAGLVKQASIVQEGLFAQKAEFKKDLIEKVNFTTVRKKGFK